MWKKREFNYEKEKQICWGVVLDHHADEPDDVKQSILQDYIKYAHRVILRVNIRNKLIDEDGYSFRWADATAHDMVDNLPEELLPNIEEWLDNKEISEITYDDFSIKQIMEYHKNKGVIHHFIQSTIAMNHYIKNGNHDKSSAIGIFYIC